MQRRRFLAAGLAGTALLAGAGLWAWLRAPGLPEGDAAAAGEILAAIVPAMLDGALPAAGRERADAIRETVANVERAIAGLPPPTRAELAQLFALLALPVGRRAFAGVASPWREADVAEIDGFLTAWQTSGWSLKRSAYDGLHQLVIASWYGNPRSWQAIRYPGPPALG